MGNLSQALTHVFFGNDTIDSYPLLENMRIEKLLICTTKTFEALKKKFDQFKQQYQTKPEKPKKKSPIKLSKPTVIPEKIYHEFQPSNISYVYNSNFWRWRRVNEWFNKNAQKQVDDKSSVFKGNPLNFDEIVALTNSQTVNF